MDRKIQTILEVESNHSMPIYIRTTNFRNGESKLQVLTSAVQYLNTVKIRKFARRSFSGARKLVFNIVTAPRPIDVQHAVGRAFITYDNGHLVELCADSTREILGVGKKTKTFSLWVK
jgi:hypothetical protein